MRRSSLIWLAPFALWAGAAFAQDKPDDKFRPEAPKKGEEEDLTPEKTLQMLKEVNELQGLAAELLNATAQGKALETERELLERVKKLLDEEKLDPRTAQTKILEKIERLMGKSEGSQKDAADKMGEIIRRARSQQGQGQGKPQPGQPPQKQTPSQPQRVQQPGSAAPAPYDPNRRGDITRFRSIAERTARWGDLPARVREALQHSKRDLDEYPPEFQQPLKEYFDRLRGDK